MMPILFPYQRAIIDATWDIPGWGLFLEMGVGKSLVAIETARKLYEAGEIRGVLVVAPNGVHANWVYDELPKWDLPWHIRLYDVARERGLRQSRETGRWIHDPHRRDLACLSMSYDGATHGAWLRGRTIVPPDATVSHGVRRIRAHQESQSTPDEGGASTGRKCPVPPCLDRHAIC